MMIPRLDEAEVWTAEKIIKSIGDQKSRESLIRKKKFL